MEARHFARDLGRLPSQNKLKARLHVRAERAKKVLEILRDSGFDPTEPEPDPRSHYRLHVVPDGASDSPTDIGATDIGHVADMSGTFAGTLPVTSGIPSREPVSSPLAGADPTVGSVEPSALPNGPAEPTAPNAAPDPGLLSQRQVSVSSAETVGEPDPSSRPVPRWPVVLLAAPAFVAIWSAWVGVGELTGFGPVRLLPGIADGFTINSAITLPIGMETYAAYALRVWLGVDCPARAREFAKWSAIAAFLLGGLGQIAYHLMTAANLRAAPWPVTAVVSCLPVVVLGFGAALAHLQIPRCERTEGTL